ncbi:hypothetical protein HHK36_022726 [Tetracentron sinense]|uniref:N-acetyltransferase domain-containing protein n=1 Tax=Tetracentron sinense TaxID=13715 RepID=A0A834YND5_TETSI|nr:hypothetical protein HHK36_022726 [Tetracentron sinense]
MEINSSKSDGFLDISLRPFDLSDVDDFMVWATDDRVTRLCGWDSFTSRDAVVNYFKDTVIPHPWFRAICINNRPIGQISVRPYSGGYRCRGELGYAIAIKYWGQGIVTKAVKMVTSSIFSECPNLERLEALASLENPASQRVLEKMGFQKEGVLRKFFIKKGKTIDVLMYSLLNTDLML